MKLPRFHFSLSFSTRFDLVKDRHLLAFFPPGGVAAALRRRSAFRKNRCGKLATNLLRCIRYFRRDWIAWFYSSHTSRKSELKPLSVDDFLFLISEYHIPVRLSQWANSDTLSWAHIGVILIRNQRQPGEQDRPQRNPDFPRSRSSLTSSKQM